jgi:hypothetical protein
VDTKIVIGFERFGAAKPSPSSCWMPTAIGSERFAVKHPATETLYRRDDHNVER